LQIGINLLCKIYFNKELY